MIDILRTFVFFGDNQRVRVRVMVFSATGNNISAISWQVSFIGRGNRSTRRKPSTCRKSL